MVKPDCIIKYKLADENHVDQMYEIEEAVFPIPWSYESLYQDVCQHEIAVYVVGICGEEVVSYAGLWYVHEESHITNIAVKENYRRRGIGKEMMRVLFKIAKDLGVKTMTLEVRASNEAAVSMYENTGFYKAGLRKKYYTDNNEDAIIMNKNL